MKNNKRVRLKNSNEVLVDDDTPLPEELIYLEIFPRLPLKSLHRFRCVSKFCRSLTSNPPFLAAFRRCKADRYVLSFLSGLEWQSVFYYSYPESQSQIIVKNTDKTYYSYIKFINDLICLVRETQVIIRKVETNEEFLLPRQLRLGSQLDKYFFYFCYDPTTNKYKVLRTTCFRTGFNMNFIVVGMSFSIFTLGVDKSWRDFDHPGLYQLTNSKSACINGVLFCTNFSTSSSNEDGVIAAYILGKEYFTIVSYPNRLSPSRYRSCHLINVKESLAIVDAQDAQSCVIRLWIKAQGLGSESWLEHRIEIPSPLVNIFNVSCNFSFTTNLNGEIVMGLAGLSTARNGCWVFCHDLDTGNWRRIDIVGVKRHVIFSDFLVEENVETPLLLRHVLKS